MKLEIKKTGINGEGIAYHQRKPFFIEGCFPGEIVECQLEDLGRYGRGKLIKVLQKSPHRIRPACLQQQDCGACALMALDYDQQLIAKKQILAESLAKYADLRMDIEIIGSPDYLHYRNKCSLPVIEQEGRLINALYRSGSNHPVAIEECPIHDIPLERTRLAILMVLNRHRLSAYDAKEKTGIRHLLVRGFDKEYQAVIVTGKDGLDRSVIDDLAGIQDLVSIYLGINTQKDPLHVIPDKLQLLHGQKKIRLHLSDRQLLLSPQAFFQLNTKQAEAIYKETVSLLPDQADHIVEAYCGIGAISLFLADHATRVTGIEIVPEAIEDAKENALLNRKDNIRFICDDAAKRIRTILKEDRIDALVVDPPRTGLDDAMKESILHSSICNIVYVSCNPATLAKDLRVLGKRYDVASIKAFDMFPNTPLIETVCCLYRKKSR